MSFPQPLIFEPSGENEETLNKSCKLSAVLNSNEQLPSCCRIIFQQTEKSSASRPSFKIVVIIYEN